MSEHPVEKGIADVVATYELLDRVRRRQDLVIRDDQFGLEALRDAARLARRRGVRVSLLDTGRLALTDLETLVRDGVAVRTSDEARPRPEEWELLLDAGRGARAFVSVFWNGPLPAPDAPSTVPVQTLEDLLKKGLDFHVTNRTRARDAAFLAELAGARSGRSYFVVYHHGPLVPELVGLAERRVWLHFSDRDADAGHWPALAVGVARAAAEAGSRAVVYVERGLDFELLAGLWSAGAALVFLTPPSDDTSYQHALERRAARRKLPARAFHLSAAFLP